MKSEASAPFPVAKMNRSSLVTPNVDLSKVEAINQKRTLAFINHWVLHTVGFLNQFSALCEERLVTLNTKLRRADQSLAILEAKLNSVPDLEGVVASSVVSTQPQSAPTNTAPDASHSQPASTAPVAETAEASVTSTGDSSAFTQEQASKEEEVAPEPEVLATPVSKDPRFASYFKMLAVGVPLPAVKMKMSSEGLDPSILDDPNAPAPPEDNDHAQDDSDSSSVSSFSD